MQAKIDEVFLIVWMTAQALRTVVRNSASWCPSIWACAIHFRLLWPVPTSRVLWITACIDETSKDPLSTSRRWILVHALMGSRKTRHALRSARRRRVFSMGSEAAIPCVLVVVVCASRPSSTCPRISHKLGRPSCGLKSTNPARDSCQRERGVLSGRPPQWSRSPCP